MERNKYLRESRTERLRIHILDLLQEKTKLEEKKHRATKLIAELKKENQELKDTILLMDENAKSRNNYFNTTLVYCKEHMGDDMMSTVLENKRLEVALIRLREEHKGLQQKYDALLDDYTRGDW